MWRQYALCAKGRGLKGVDAISRISGVKLGVSESCSVACWAADVRPGIFVSTIFPTRFSRRASRFKRGTGVHYASLTLGLGLALLLNGGWAGDVPTTAQVDHGVSATASVAPQLSIRDPHEKRLLDTLLATEGYKNLAPEYKAWVTADAVRALQQLPLRYRQALVDNALVLVERVEPHVPQLMSYYLAFAAATEIGAETGWLDVRVNPRGRIRVKTRQSLDETSWKFIEWRVCQLLGTADGLPEPLAMAIGRKKSKRDCTSGSRYAEDLGINFPKY